ncbi:asparagine synthase (glutamine-hydrolyzing) [Alphaproteobacteria bacterium]|nr:asparagine synthase (glutamine-hydrolyzing) [Alphaproteobacteria bacterium]
MCGIAGVISLNGDQIPNIEKRLGLMSELIAHRGPDGDGSWVGPKQKLGFVHRRLAIIDLTENANQPMIGPNKSVITYNGEIYNFPELKDTLKSDWQFKSDSDTECVLASYDKFGKKCLANFRGMFSFALWDETKNTLFCARDRFGIKPFYYFINGNIFYFASEAKALIPFLSHITTDEEALAEYLTFQHSIGEKTLFEGIKQLMPGHSLCIEDGNLIIEKYWDISYEVDFQNDQRYFQDTLRDLLEQSVKLHARGDVKIGSYVSGGIDSSLIYNIATQKTRTSKLGFHGKYTEFEGYDESDFALEASRKVNGNLECVDINSDDFKNNIEKIIYHLDFPVAGPGAFSQFMVSELASKHVKVVLGGQGGDEIFGGYSRYIIAYLEQALKAAIDGTYKNGNFVVTIESIIPNLGILREYKPLIKKFWSNGLFGPMDRRYFELINRSGDLKEELDLASLNFEKVYSDFSKIFNNSSNVRKEAYFDKMTNFDFKCILPALLHVEDRMSMAHGIESRVPFLDHKLVEFAASIPANFKFEGGNMKHLLKETFKNELPEKIRLRRDKMGFPVPLKEWFDGDLNEYAKDIFSSMTSKDRPLINSSVAAENLRKDVKFSRKNWVLLSIETWHQQFHDKAHEWKKRGQDCS